MLELPTVAELIETLTPAALAGALNVSVQAISNMKQRDAIPPRHWFGVVELATQHPTFKNFTADDLRIIHTPAPRAPQRESARSIHQPRRAGAVR